MAHDLGVDFQPLVNISEDELLITYGRSRLMVYAPRLEPFGYTPLEANACGLPVVAVAEGGVRETVQDGINGLVVEHDPEALSQAMFQFLSNPEYSKKIGRAGRQLVEQNWSLSASIDRLEKRLEQVLILKGVPQ
jgi:glycosyltransferase involved in cell wall biosynthesis